MRLVPTVQGVLDTLEGDETFPHFMLDGQVALVDDYLAIRPQDEERLRRLIREDRLSLGPWYVLMDEFLISGETLIRNLELGRARAHDLGGAMAVGYLPDMFGHIAQMPQILNQFGIDRAVVWRGVPSEITTTSFTWQSPDGSSVSTEYLPLGYSNASQLPTENPEFLDRFRDYLIETADLLGEDVLMMNGGDHVAIMRELPRLVDEANASQDDLVLEITSLEHYLAESLGNAAVTWRGELRSGFRANLLMGVASNHVGVKQRTAHAERALERHAEPLSAMFLEPSPERDTYLAEAWLHLIHNAAHDSICACSVDEVIHSVLARARKAESIATAIAREALSAFARRLSREGVSALNLSSFEAAGVVEYTTSGDHAPEHTQILSQTAGIPGTVTIDAGMMKTLLGMLQGPRFGDDAWIQTIAVSEDDDGLHVTATIGTEERPGVPIAAMKQDIFARLGARPDIDVHLTLEQPPIYKVLALTGPVPSLGWAPVTPRVPDNPVVLSSDGMSMSNGLLSVAVATDGSFSLNGVAGFGRLVDGGDLGDSYNYSPPADDRVIDTPSSVQVTCIEAGALRTKLVIERTFDIPQFADEASQGRIGSVATTMTTTITLEADQRDLALEVVGRNLSSDHRLRLHVPLMEAATNSQAGSAFATVTRGLDAEGRPDEFGLPTFPASRYVSAGRLSVAFSGVREYELVSIHDGKAHELAITLLRATGMLSRLGMVNRPFPAGPLTPTPALQMLGEGIAFSCRIGIDVDAVALAEGHDLPLDLVSSFGGGDLEHQGRLLDIDGAVISSLRRHHGALELRLYNPRDEDANVSLGDHQVERITLDGQRGASASGKLTLRGHEIATLLIRET